MANESLSRNEPRAIWREGDRVEIHGVPRYEGCRGRVVAPYPPSELDEKWTRVALDDVEGTRAFQDHELTRLEDR